MLKIEDDIAVKAGRSLEMAGGDRLLVAAAVTGLRVKFGFYRRRNEKCRGTERLLIT